VIIYYIILDEYVIMYWYRVAGKAGHIMKMKRKNKSLRAVSVFKLNSSFDLISDCVIPYTAFSPNQTVEAIIYKNKIVIKPIRTKNPPKL